MHPDLVIAIQDWFETDAIPIKYSVTKIEIANRKCNDSNLIHNEPPDGPPRQLLQFHITRYQLTHQDYCPIDVGSIRWLIGQSSTLQFLSLEQGEAILSRPSLFPNDTVTLLERLRNAIRYGYRTFGDRQLRETPLFIQMEWMHNFQTPTEIMHRWMVIDRFLHDIQNSVSEGSSDAMNQWLTVLRSHWDFLLKEVRSHFFFRHFRRIEDIPRFQHSVRWTIFFYMFQTNLDSQEMIALKEMIISTAVFRKGIHDFIETVEMSLDTVKPIEFSPMNMSSNGAQMDVEMNLVLDSLNNDDWYQRWWAGLLIDSYDRWRSTMVATLESDPMDYPRKQVLAATMLWEVETIVAFIEPKLFERRHPHRVLLSLRNRIRSYVFHFFFKESCV